MTQDEIIRMAREAGFPVDEHGYNTKRIERFAALVAAKLFTYEQVKAHIQAAVLSEREACAKVCETDELCCKCGDECAAAIRSMK